MAPRARTRRSFRAKKAQQSNVWWRRRAVVGASDLVNRGLSLCTQHDDCERNKRGPESRPDDDDDDDDDGGGGDRGDGGGDEAGGRRKATAAKRTRLRPSERANEREREDRVKRLDLRRPAGRRDFAPPPRSRILGGRKLALALAPLQRLGFFALTSRAALVQAHH